MFVKFGSVAPKRPICAVAQTVRTPRTMSPVRHAFFAVTSLAIVTLAAACGGAIDSPRGDQIDPNAPGSGGGAGGVVGTCTAAPSCDPGDSRVSSESACPLDQASCYDRTFCGQTIWCAHVICRGRPECADGYRRVPSCKGTADCVTTSGCGETVSCARLEAHCDGLPNCDPGDTQVASASQCLQDDATCYTRWACGTSIWCTGPNTDAGPRLPPPPPAKP